MKSFLTWLEDIQTMYKSTVDNFPNTTKRHNVVDEVPEPQMKIEFNEGAKTVQVNAEVSGSKGPYLTKIRFHGVEFIDPKEANLTSFVKKYNKNGQNITYALEKINTHSSQVKVSCSCPDYHNRFSSPNNNFGANLGSVTSNHNTRDNPKNVPGLCKHIIKVFEACYERGLTVNSMPHNTQRLPD